MREAGLPQIAMSKHSSQLMFGIAPSRVRLPSAELARSMKTKSTSIFHRPALSRNPSHLHSYPVCDTSELPITSSVSVGGPLRSGRLFSGTLQNRQQRSQLYQPSCLHGHRRVLEPRNLLQDVKHSNIAIAQNINTGQIGAPQVSDCFLVSARDCHRHRF